MSKKREIFRTAIDYMDNVYWATLIDREGKVMWAGPARPTRREAFADARRLCNAELVMEEPANA